MAPTAAPHADALALQRLYHWERHSPGKRVFVQPYGPGDVRHWTWGEALIETRRMAAHLQSLGLPPGSRIALISPRSDPASRAAVITPRRTRSKQPAWAGVPAQKRARVMARCSPVQAVLLPRPSW